MVYHFLVRLVDSGTIESQGRIEVFYNVMWTGVCGSSSRSQQEAKVVCRQLGYEGAEQTPYGNPFGSEARITWMENVRCTGTERSLQQCQHSKARSIRFRSGCFRGSTAVCSPAGKKCGFFASHSTLKDLLF